MQQRKTYAAAIPKPFHEQQLNLNPKLHWHDRRRRRVPDGRPGRRGNVGAIVVAEGGATLQMASRQEKTAA
jgi:hypothetical protein